MEEVQEALVVALVHVEQRQQLLVVAARVRQPFADDRAHVVARDVARHERLVHDLPEALFLVDHPVKQRIGAGLASGGRIRSWRGTVGSLALASDHQRDVGGADQRVGLADGQPLDEISQLTHVTRPRVLRQACFRF